MSSNIYCGKEIVNNDRVIVYETVWNEEIIRFLSCHRVKQVSLVPGTSFMVQLSEFVRHALQFDEHTSLIFKNMVFSNILFIDKTLYEKKIQIEYNKETKQLILRSIKETSGSDDVEIIHLTTFVHTRDYETYPEMKYKTDDVQCQQQYPGGERFYESISNDYQGEFRNLGTVYAINDNELVTTITYDTVPSLVEMRKCAMMDVATQMTMVLSSDEEKRNGFYLHSVGDCVFHPSFFKLTDSDVNNFYVECITSEGVEWNESSGDFFIFNHQKECVIEFRQFRGGKFDTKLHRLYEDVWTLVDQQMEMDHLEDYEWITIDGDDCFTFHNSLDFTKRPNMVVITNSENDISSYLRSVRIEYPDWDIRTIITTGDDAMDLMSTKTVPKDLQELKYENKMFNQRILAPLKLVPCVQALTFDTRGSINNLKLVDAKPIVKRLNFNDIEVFVTSTGLNFRDVLNILGMYPGDPGFPGGDFAGYITRVGKSVTRFKKGDRVFGIAYGSLRTYTITNEYLIQPVPKEWSMEEACAVPILITTVHEALVNLSNIKKNDTVLIHAGAGGIGLTAIQYAQKFGCNIITTCGSKEKRVFLESLGVYYITSSRDSEQFLKDMKEWGMKVDIVVNALSDNFIPYSADFIKDGGHFCEIGKRDIWAEARFQKAYPHVNYHIIAIDTMMVDNPLEYNQLFRDAISLNMSPVSITTFQFDRYVEAFEYLRDAKNIGKVVITQKQLYDQDGTFLITGGLGFVGKHIAQTLYDNGARDIVLISSSKDCLPEDWSLDFTPRVFKCDVSKRSDVKELFQRFQCIKGIVHAAGVLSDKTLTKLTADDFHKVYQPKVVGAMNIDSVLQELGQKPDFVVLCSSIASGIGGGGQANYSAANGALDHMAMTNKTQNYISIRWGAWLGGGMAMDETIQRSARMGILGLDYRDAITQFNTIVASDKEGLKVVTVTPLDPIKLPQTSYFNKLREHLNDDADMKKSNYESMIQRLHAMKTKEEQYLLIEKSVIDLAKSTGVEVSDTTLPWREMGFDSLSMIEFKNVLSQYFNGIKMSDTVLFDYPTAKSFSNYILENIGLLKVLKKDKKVNVADPIAIVGLACNFPGSNTDPVTFYDYLMNRGDAMKEIPHERFNPVDYAADMYCTKGAFIDNVYSFDNEYFGISVTEAELMDPQQRITLECVEEALQYCNTTIDRSDCGVYIAACSNDFAYLIPENKTSVFKATGNASSIIANRISYLLNMQGPSMTIDTACSSSLVALDTACRAIQNNDCTSAVVGGVNLNLTQHNFINFCSAKMLSPNGRCATFSDQADGYARGEGCGVIILKNLKQAVKDKDDIFAVVYGTAVNQDGRSANLTSPNGPSQERVIQTAMDKAGLDVDDIDFIEAHGTGTPLGDPQEIQAISNVFEKRKEKLPIGAVKTNIGHLEGAAGMAGVIKVIMSLQHKKLPPNIHCEKPNERIVPYLDKNVTLPIEPYLLDETKKAFYAGVSSFGFGGTNAHAILGFSE